MIFDFKDDEASSDESGKGDFFGGLHVCAVLINQECYKLLIDQNIANQITDSKNLNNNQIKQLAPKLINCLKNNYAFVSILSEEYNQTYKKLNNLNILLSYAHNKAWKKLLTQTNCKNFIKIIDQFCSKNLYENYLNQIKESIIPIDIFITKAESKYLSCATASIISRYLFIQEIEKISEIFNFLIPFGNSYNPNNSVVDAYVKILRKCNNIDEINKYCKNHFKTLQKIHSFI